MTVNYFPDSVKHFQVPVVSLAGQLRAGTLCFDIIQLVFAMD